jgi:hypothetical protein
VALSRHRTAEEDIHQHLLWRPRNDITNWRQLSEEIVGGGGPGEGPRADVVGGHKGGDPSDQLLGAGEGATADRAAGQDREPALDLVQPGGVGRRVVDLEALPLGEPGADLGMLVGGVVVDNEMDVEPSRHGRVDAFEERQEFLMAVARLALGQHLSVGDIEGGKQRGRAVPLVVVGDAVDVAKPDRQDGLGALERLDLAFLVPAQDDRVIRRIEIEPDDVPNLFDEQGVGRELERPGAVRLDPKSRK